MALIYKIMTPAQWAQTEASGLFPGASVDLADGFVHFSTAAQVGETVARHFAGAGELVLAAVEGDALGDALRFEPSRGGDLFPHLYGSLKAGDILWAKAFDADRPDDLRRLLAG